MISMQSLKGMRLLPAISTVNTCTYAAAFIQDSTVRTKNVGLACGSSSRMPGNHVHGNGLPATFVPSRRNVCEGYWATDES